MHALNAAPLLCVLLVLPPGGTVAAGEEVPPLFDLLPQPARRSAIAAVPAMAAVARIRATIRSFPHPVHAEFA
jgi:hypothetical protein